MDGRDLLDEMTEHRGYALNQLSIEEANPWYSLYVTALKEFFHFVTGHRVLELKVVFLHMHIMPYNHHHHQEC